MKQFNVLIFPGGTEIGLEIRKALVHCKEVRLFSAAMEIPNHAPFVYQHHFVIPAINEETWVDALIQVIAEHHIDYVFPAYDDVLVALAEIAPRLGAKVVIPPLDTCRLTRSKSATYRRYRGLLPIPKVFEQPEQIDAFPVFVKPDKGQGSQGTTLARNPIELKLALANDPTAIALEYLPGPEVTVDCFSDRERGILFCRGRLRVRTKSGISMASKFIDDPVFQKYAETIQEHLTIYGAWFFQLKQDAAGVYKLLEIAPRVAGTMALNRVTGVNFPLLSIFEQERIPLQIRTNPGLVEIERSLINRFKHDFTYEAVYVDLDDTLIVHGKVNIELVQFIFQCVNRQIPVNLLTRHAEDLRRTLRRYRLTELFDEIILIKADERKSDFIHEPTAIFIDDSFSERRQVSLQLGILTFDTSSVEVLLDERQ